METCTLVTCAVCGKSKEQWKVCYVANKNYPDTLASTICVACIRKRDKS